MSNFLLNAEFRDDAGKGASRRLRRGGKVPAVLYGGERPPRSITLSHTEISHHLENEAFYSSVITLKVGDKEQPAILKDIQRHPARRLIMHVDLQRVLEDKEIRMNVPIHFVGESAAPGVKKGGTVSHTVNELEITCLPKYLPEFIEVDLAAVDMDGVFKLSDVSLPDGVSLAHPPGEDYDPALASIHKVRVQVEPEEGEELPAAVPASEQKSEPSEG